jgi:GNAT superfamily N-acetyltransferase
MNLAYKTIPLNEFYNFLPNPHKSAKESLKYADEVGSLIARVKFSEALFNQLNYHILDQYMVICLYNKKIIGISKFGHYVTDTNKDYWMLGFISVDPAYKNRGISKELIKLTIQFLVNNKIDKFKLSSLEEEGKLYKVAHYFYKECVKYNIDLTLGYGDWELEKQLKSEK